MRVYLLNLNTHWNFKPWVATTISLLMWWIAESWHCSNFSAFFTNDSCLHELTHLSPRSNQLVFPLWQKHPASHLQITRLRNQSNKAFQWPSVGILETKLQLTTAKYCYINALLRVRLSLPLRHYRKPAFKQGPPPHWLDDVDLCY